MTDTVTLVGAAIVLVLYLVPSILAFHTKHKEATSILLLNLLLGWTVLGWGAAFFWADRACRRKRSGSDFNTYFLY